MISVNRRTRFSAEMPNGGMSLGLPPRPRPTVNRPLLMWSRLPRLLANWIGFRNGATSTDVPSRTFSVVAALYDRERTGPQRGPAPGLAHGDPHLGTSSVREDVTVNLLAFGCVRVFAPKFVKGVIDLYHALERGQEALAVSAYESWGFVNLSRELLDALDL